MLWISVFQALPNATAAIQVHGTFDSADAAQLTVQQKLADEQTDVGAYIVDHLDV